MPIVAIRTHQSIEIPDSHAATCNQELRRQDADPYDFQSAQADK